MTFQFSLWDKFKELENLPSTTFNNLVQLVTRFLQRKCLSLSILKVSVLIRQKPVLVDVNIISPCSNYVLGFFLWCR